jgi:hypothetical protein
MRNDRNHLESAVSPTASQLPSREWKMAKAEAIF